MPLEANRIQLVAPAEIRMCELCGAGPMPGRMDYVAFNNKSGDDFAPGLILTVDEQPARTAYRRRDSTSGQTAATIFFNPQICCDCIQRAAGLIGYGDTGPLATELDELRAQNDNLRERLEASEHQREQAERDFRDSARREHMLAAGPPATRPAAKTAGAREGLTMGRLAEDGRWVPSDERGAKRVDRMDAAKRAMRLAHRSDRPIEAAAGDGRDPAHRAARHFAALTHSVDPNEISAKDISAVLEHGRKAAGHDDNPATASAYNAAAIGELAEDTDDNYEDIAARSDEDEHDDYEDGYEDSDDARFDWLEDTYGISADELAEALQALDPDDVQAAIDAFAELYSLHLQGDGLE